MKTYRFNGFRLGGHCHTIYYVCCIVPCWMYVCHHHIILSYEQTFALTALLMLRASKWVIHGGHRIPNCYCQWSHYIQETYTLYNDIYRYICCVYLTFILRTTYIRNCNVLYTDYTQYTVCVCACSTAFYITYYHSRHLFHVFRRRRCQHTYSPILVW